jgi:putative ABC transport system permease protein
MRGLFAEIALISLTGGLIGWGAGTLVSWAIVPYFVESDLGLIFRPAQLPLAVAAALGIGVVSSLFPIVRASRLDPAEAVRAV